MSLGIVFKGAEGIVLAADSRVTLMATRTTDNVMLPAFFDNATKLLKVTGQDFVGAVTYGLGAIIGKESGPRTAHSYLPEFETELRDAETERLSVEEFASRLADFFMRQWAAAEVEDDTEAMIFLVGGYDEGEPYGRVFQCAVPGSLIPVEQNPGDFGATWGGQLQSASRLINGYDPSLPQVIQEFLELDADRQGDIRGHLNATLGLPIPWQFLPLQDCVDLCILLVRTTAQLQTFLVDVRGVGGDIDVATITRTEGFKPVQQKEITGERFEF